MKIVSIVGARPEFVQAAPITRELRENWPDAQEVFVHTGQHYDFLMSQVFFQELTIPEPHYNLGVGSGSHGRQTGEMLGQIEEVLVKEKPDWVVIRGDTNSTLAGALAAAKLHVPLAHVESGARSFNRAMPEEINRLVADRVSDLLFCVAPSAVGNLAAEGIEEGVHYVGDVMYDACLQNLPVARQHSRAIERLGLRPKEYVLATVHRAGNTDDPRRLRDIVSALSATEHTVVFPVHPRTRKAIDAAGLSFGPRVHAVEPVGYIDMLALEAGADAIVTDSGGVTREAFFVGVPCITLREETEHVETVECGWNTLVGADPDRILDAIRCFRPNHPRPPIFGDGTAASRIANLLVANTHGPAQ